MKNLIILGAGGMGRTLFDMACESHGYREDFIIKGFLDDNYNALDDYMGYPPVKGNIDTYIPHDNDVFVCSIGSEIRKKCIEKILENGGQFYTLIHKTARIGSNVKLGKGNLIGAYTTIAADAVVGDYNFIQSYTIIGHDVQIGNWNRIDSYVMCVGGISIQNEIMIHTGAVLNHNVIIEDCAHVAACSFVTRRVEKGTTVFGNPARRLI